MNVVDNCSILSGAASRNGSVYIAVINDVLAEERRQHSIPLRLDRDSWRSIACEPVLPWLVAGVAVVEQPSPQAVIVGWGGQVLVTDGDTCDREGIQRKDSKDVSIVRAAATISDVVYAVGMRRQVHVRIGPRSWEQIDRGVAYEGDRMDVGFNAVCGFDRSELYAAGLNGEIWHYDGRQWQEVQSPTNVHLHSMCCGADGTVYIGGRAGVLLRGRGDSWEVLDIGATETIWDVHSFLDKLYLITNRGVLAYLNGEAGPVGNGLLSYADFLRFSSSVGKMWLFGRKKIVEFDGSLWREQTSALADTEPASPAFRFFTNDVLSLGSDYLEP